MLIIEASQKNIAKAIGVSKGAISYELKHNMHPNVVFGFWCRCKAINIDLK
jgi:IS30 family transposase